MSDKIKYKSINGVSFNVNDVKKKGKSMFVKLFKKLAEKKNANVEEWYSELTGK